jgi:hypothetical protein
VNCVINLKSRVIAFASASGGAYSRATKTNKKLDRKGRQHMNSFKKTVLILALGLAAGGCSVLERSKSSAAVGREDLRNAQGHVVGYKDVLRNADTGEEVQQLLLFVPRTGNRGEIVGYEERVPGGTVLRDLNGKRIGGRYLDARSRGTNPQSRGLLIVVRGKNSDRIATAQAPDIDQLMHLARITN